DRRSSRPDPPPSTLGAWIGQLELDGNTVRVRASVTGEQFPRWEAAKLDVRPLHLRGRGYPLVGVRVVGFFMGQKGCIDALVDAATAGAADLFRVLSREFRVAVSLRVGSREIHRDVARPGLAPNATLCLPAARGRPGGGGEPTERLPTARPPPAEQTAPP